MGTWDRLQEVSAEDLADDLEEGEYLYGHKIPFSADNSFTELIYLAHKENQEIIGYLSKNQGTYTTAGNRLQFNFNRWFSNEQFDSRFVAIEDLILIHEDQVESLNYSFSGNRTRLVIDFDPCGTLESCLDKNEFQKVK